MSHKIDLLVGIIGLVLGIAALCLWALGMGESQIWIAAIPLIAFGLNAAYRGWKNLKIEKGLGVRTLAADPELVHFLNHSYGTWQSGDLADYSDQYEKKTRKRSLAWLVEALLSDAAIRETLASAFKMEQPDEKDIFLSIIPGSYLLTKERIYLFGSAGRAIKLKDIESYSSQAGPPPACTFKLTSGEGIEALQLDQVPGEATLNRLRTHPVS